MRDIDHRVIVAAAVRPEARPCLLVNNAERQWREMVPVTQDFTALAEQQSNKNLDALFGPYLYKRGKP